MRTLIAILVALALTAGAREVTAQDQPLQATAEFKTSVGETVGNATLTQNVDGSVRLQVQVRGLPTGEHGIHIHAVGACAPSFDAAGGHFNPAGKQHGRDNPAGPHAGDLPNITINADGTGALDTTTNMVSLAAGATSLFDADGSAIVIHAYADDHMTDPAGNSGPRIACAVVQQVAAQPATQPATQPTAQPAPPAGGTPAQLPSTSGAELPWLPLSLAALLILSGGLALHTARLRR